MYGESVREGCPYHITIELKALVRLSGQVESAGTGRVLRVLGDLGEPGHECGWSLGTKAGDSIKVQRPPEAITWRTLDVRLMSLSTLT